MKTFKKWIEEYQVMPALDKDEYPDREREGLEGPFRLKSGLVVYYDRIKGSYYDPKTDLFLSDDDYLSHNGDLKRKL